MWITGPAGIGKSGLMARLALQLLDEARGRESRPDKQKLLILPYRFHGGDARAGQTSSPPTDWNVSKLGMVFL